MLRNVGPIFAIAVENFETRILTVTYEVCINPKSDTPIRAKGGPNCYGLRVATSGLQKKFHQRRAPVSDNLWANEVVK